MKQLPTMRQLQYLVALDQYRHFGQAALHCHVTTATLSAGIKELEQVLGIQVAERSNKHVLLTKTGKQLVERARQILSQAADMKNLSHSSQKLFSDPFYLGVIPTIGPFLIPEIIAKTTTHYPELALYIDEQQTDILLEKLENGEIDAALLALPYEIGKLSHYYLGSDAFMFVCNSKHEFANHDSISLKEIKKEQILLMEDGHCLKQHTLPFCELNSNQISGWKANSLFTLVQMIAAGRGAGVIPKMAIKSRFFESLDIRVLTLKEHAEREIHLVWRTHSVNTNNILAFADLVKKILDEFIMD